MMCKRQIEGPAYDESTEFNKLEDKITQLEAQLKEVRNALEPFAILVAGSDDDHDWLPHPNEIVCGHGGRMLHGQAFRNAIEAFGAVEALEALKTIKGDHG